MGSLCSCFNGSSDVSRENSLITPDAETRRMQLSNAAERRISESERRGIKDVDKVKRQQERAAKQDKLEMDAAKMGNSPSLKWQSN